MAAVQAALAAFPACPRVQAAGCAALAGLAASADDGWLPAQRAAAVSAVVKAMALHGDSEEVFTLLPCPF